MQTVDYRHDADYSGPSQQKYRSSQPQQYELSNSAPSLPLDIAQQISNNAMSGSVFTQIASPLSSNSIPSPPSVSPVPVSEHTGSHRGSADRHHHQEQHPDRQHHEQQNREQQQQQRQSGSYHTQQEELEDKAEDVRVREALQNVVSLKQFLLAAPIHFTDVDIIRQYRLPTDEQISCVRWNRLFCITGTDIVRCLVYRFSLFGRDVINRKKFEEGVFSDLRNLKIDVDAMLENPKSELLDFLYKRHCVRTKKKQKIFFWHSVQHERLFVDALERELKKEAAAKGHAATGNSNALAPSSLSATVAVREPAVSFKYDSALPLSEQLPHIMEGFPDLLAMLVHEATTPLKSVNAVVSEVGANVPISHAEDQRNDGMYQTGSEYPITPLQSREKLSFEPMAMVSPWYPETPARQTIPVGLVTPQSLNHKPVVRPSTAEYTTNDASTANTNTSTSTTNSRPPSVLAQKHANAWPSRLPPRGPRQSWVQEAELVNHDSAEPTDFPLDVLAKEDQTYQRYAGGDTGLSFETRYTEFAYSNRPAVLFDSSAQVTQQPPVVASLASPFNFGLASTGFSPIRRSFPQQVPPPQSPDWDQYVTSFDWHMQSSHRPYAGPDLKQTRVPHGFSSHYMPGNRVTKSSSHRDFPSKAQE